MYTNCPNCSKEFEIYAEHLKAANGMVRCGTCHTAFNALVRLYDQPKQLDLPTLDSEVVDESEENQAEEIFEESLESEAEIDSDEVVSEVVEEQEVEDGDDDYLKPDTIEDIEYEEDKTLTDIEEEITDNIDELELTIQDQNTQVEFEDEEETTDSEEVEVNAALELDTNNAEDVVSIEIDHALQDVDDIPEDEATIEDHITNIDFESENTLDGIEEANIEEEITLDEDNVEQIRESVEQFKLLMGEDEEAAPEDKEVEESETFLLKNDIANIDGDVDPELQALTDLLDEVDDYIPEPEFKITDSSEEETKEPLEEYVDNQEEPFKLNLSGESSDKVQAQTEDTEQEADEQQSLSVKPEEIDVINQAIDRIQQDDSQKIELPDIGDDLLEPETPPEPLPEILEEQKASTNYGMIIFWTLLAIIVLLLGFSQVAWFNRDMLLEKYPQYYPQAKQFCDQMNSKGWFECKLRRYKNLSALQIKERDVRLHPEFEKTLLINASMVNMAKYAQDFPSIQIILFGDSGEQTAQVEITPDDYLDNSIDRKLGMQPEIPVHFIVEVNGEIESANSFEFNFF